MQLLLWLGGGAVALTALGALARGIWWLMRKLVHIADAVEQLLPNGGMSLADKVTRIDQQVADLTKQFQDHIKT